MGAKAAVPVKVVIELTHSKETKGTHVYANLEHEINLYFPKSLGIFRGESAPKKIQMTLEVQ